VARGGRSSLGERLVAAQLPRVFVAAFVPTLARFLVVAGTIVIPAATIPTIFPALAWADGLHVAARLARGTVAVAVAVAVAPVFVTVAAIPTTVFAPAIAAIAAITSIARVTVVASIPAITATETTSWTSGRTRWASRATIPSSKTAITTRRAAPVSSTTVTEATATTSAPEASITGAESASKAATESTKPTRTHVPWRGSLGVSTAAETTTEAHWLPALNRSATLDINFDAAALDEDAITSFQSS
jgi:hypothetical protein